MRTAACSLLIVAAALAAATSAAGHGLNIDAYSQRDSSSRASIGGSVQVRAREPGNSGVSAPTSPAPSSPGAGSTYTGSPSGEVSYPSDSPFWDVGQVPCATPTTVGTCYSVPAPGGRARRRGAGAPAIDPQLLAQFAADRLALMPGAIETSPSRQVKGLTGAPSWFWLDPAPRTESVTIAQGAETVTVTAVPSSVVWAFGDGASLDGGPGRPYRAREGGEGSVRHRYRTRCLPGDRGRNPYVLESCTADGYEVEASVEWTISFQAIGPITTGGALPSQTTSATVAYPVGEVRGFLARDGASR